MDGRRSALACPRQPAPHLSSEHQARTLRATTRPRPRQAAAIAPRDARRRALHVSGASQPHRTLILVAQSRTHRGRATSTPRRALSLRGQGRVVARRIGRREVGRGWWRRPERGRRQGWRQGQRPRAGLRASCGFELESNRIESGFQTLRFWLPLGLGSTGIRLSSRLWRCVATPATSSPLAFLVPGSSCGLKLPLGCVKGCPGST